MPSDPVDSALADLALAAVSRLKQEMNVAKQSKDRIAAANSILDRLGYGRATRAQAEVADAEIRRALEAVGRARLEAEQKQVAKSESEPAKELAEGVGDD